MVQGNDEGAAPSIRILFPPMDHAQSLKVVILWPELHRLLLVVVSFRDVIPLNRLHLSHIVFAFPLQKVDFFKELLLMEFKLPHGYRDRCVILECLIF